MRDAERWLRRQVDEVRDLLREADEAFGRGDLAAANDDLDEALVILDMAEFVNDTVHELRARTLNELGLVHRHAEATEEAHDFHARAADTIEELDRLDEEFVYEAAAIKLNAVNSILSVEGDLGEARRRMNRIEELVERGREEHGQPPQDVQLSLEQNRSLLESLSGNLEQAAESAERALELTDSLVDEGMPSALPQAARTCQQMSVQLFEAGEHERAVEWGQRAEEVAERAHEHFGEAAVPLYVVSQINLLSFYEELHRFADAEDALWKAIETAGPDPEILWRGREFYEYCNELLELAAPPVQVEMGVEDLENVIDEIGGLPDPEQMQRFVAPE
ncbi:MAG: hypothetical protein ABEL76_11345 [Bradymonadaceae bacterium]